MTRFTSALSAVLLLFAAISCGGGGGGNPLPQPVAPVAGITTSVANGRAPLIVTFTSTSTDADGTLVAFRWDFDGDGTTDRTTTTGVTEFIYTEDGTFTATLTVVDDDGLSDSAAVTVGVTAAGFELHLIDAAGDSIGAGPAVAIVDGNPAIAYLKTDEGRSVFRRATDPRGTNWGAPAEVDIDGGDVVALGVFDGSPAVLYVRDLGGVPELIFARGDDGLGTSFSKVRIEQLFEAENRNVVLLTLAGNPAVFFVGRDGGAPAYFVERALDAAGADWSGSPLQIASIAEFATIDVAVISGNPAILIAQNDRLQYARANDAAGTDWQVAAVLLTEDYESPSIDVHLLEVAGRPMSAGTARDGIDRQVRIFRGNDANGTSWSEVSAVPEFNDPFVDDFGLLNGRPVLVMDDTDSDATHLILADDDAGTAFGTLIDIGPDGRTSYLELNGAAGFAMERENGSGLFFVSQDS